MLDKTVQAATGSTLPTGAVVQTFTFDVTLTAPDVNTELKDFISADYLNSLDGIIGVTEASNYTATNAATSTKSSWHFKVTIADKKTTDVNAENMTRTISNIPIGTKYTVTESQTNGDMPSVENYHIVPSSGASNATLSHSPTNQANVEITNTYHQHLSLNVSKAVDGSPPTNIPNANYEYTLLITLTQPDTARAFTGYPVAISSSVNGTSTTMYEVVSNEAGSNTYSSIESGRQFAIKLKNGESVDFTGLPVGTTYSITESNNSQADTTSVGYSNETSPNGGMTADVSASVTNNYQTGTLKLQKAFVNGTSSSDKFTFNVALSLPANSHLASHLTLSDYTIKKKVGNEAGDGTSVSLDNNNQFTVDVGAGANEYVVISGIPQGVAYTGCNLEFIVQ